jgi:hypothetical protein
MLSAIRSRITYVNVVATLVLVFAMTGGAYAAKKYLITSTKQISPSVLKALQGKAGPAGANGAQGAAGSAGPQGPQGSQGAAGARGADGKEGPAGKEGKQGEEGEKGPKGEKGDPGPTCNPSGQCLLPVGATETGVWSFRDKGPSAAFVSISFPLRLSGSPTFHFVTFSEQGTSKAPQGCPSGFPSEPEALPGNLCVYEGEPVSEGQLVNAEIPTMVTGESDPTSGEVLNFTFTNPANEARGSGTWAVAR